MNAVRKATLYNKAAAVAAGTIVIVEMARRVVEVEGEFVVLSIDACFPKVDLNRATSCPAQAPFRKHICT